MSVEEPVPPSPSPMAQANDAGAMPAIVAAAGPAASAAWNDFVAGPDLSPSTRNLYRQRAVHFLHWLAGRSSELLQVTPRLVEQYLDEQEAAPSSKVNYRAALRCFFEALAARGVIASNPAEAARLPTLAELKRQVHELALDPIEENDEDFQAALVLVAGLPLGTAKLQAISRLTAVPLPRVEEFAERLRANGIWTPDGKTAAAWLEEYGQLAFWLDVWVATGTLAKVPAADSSSGEGVPDPAGTSPQLPTEADHP